MRLLGVSLSILAIACSAFGQTYTIHTIAGGGLPLGLSAASANLGTTSGVAVDSAGNVLIVLANYDMVVRIDAATGDLSPVAGNGTAGYSGDGGPATSAQLNDPEGIAVDQAGNLYIADVGNAVIRKVSNGTITTMGSAGGFAGRGASIGIAVDSAGNVYVPDTNANRVIKLPPGGPATTFAGNGSSRYYSGDNGSAIQAELFLPHGVAVDAAGNVYIADSLHNAVRMVSPGGIITTVAGGNGISGYNGDGIRATTAQLNSPMEVAVDAAGNLYIADTGNSRIREVTRGVISTIAQTDTDNITVDAAGNVYAAVLAANWQVIEVSNGTVTVIAGGSQTTGGNGPATSAQLDGPQGVAVDGSGNVFVADTCLREVSNGAIADVAGQTSPRGLAMDAAGNVYVADGNLVKMVTPAGVVTTVAGTGTPGYNGDNIPATSAQLYGPGAVAVDSAGNVYIADTLNNRVRKVSGGVITTVAGTAVGGYNGDGMAATAAEVGMPEGIAVDSAGNLFIADFLNYRVREVSNGFIATVAGNGTGVGDGQPATSVQLGLPTAVALDSVGGLYVADMTGSRVRRISGGISNTIAGDGTAAFGGDGGPSTGAQLYYPRSLAVDSTGAVYIADTGNNRIRLLSPSGAPCTFAVTPSSFTALPVAGGSLVVNIQAPSGCAWALTGVPAWWITASSSTGSGPGSVTLTVAANTGAARNALFLVAGVPVLVTQEGVGAAPSILAGGVVNAASFMAPLAPGSIASAFGDFLVSVVAGSAGSPLPTSFFGLSLQINSGTTAPLFFISREQVNFQVPWELSGQTQTILAGALNGTTGAAQTVSLAQFAPAIFSTNGQGTGQGAILDSSYRLVDSTHPAAAGSTFISIYCTGLGPVTNQAVTGAPALSDPLSWTTTVPTVTIGGAPASVSFYGLAPGYAGLYQVNVQVPAGSAKGNMVPVSILIGGAASNTVTLAVQ